MTQWDDGGTGYRDIYYETAGNTLSMSVGSFK